ncbi:MAG: hypothetical protein ACREGI_05940, partial [Candidatus Levyibacteriota bacterium]
HKYLGINTKTFNETIRRSLLSIEFEEGYFIRLKRMMLEELVNLEINVTSDAISYGERVIEIQKEQQGIKETIKKSSSAITIKMLEEDIETLEAEKKELIKNRNKKEKLSFDLQKAINQAKYLLEHPEELILGASDPIQGAALFGLLFKETPTYEDLIAGTPKLEPFIKLIQEKHLSNFQLAG